MSSVGIEMNPVDPERVVILVSPHSGILETWLPVISSLRKIKPGIRIHAILPRPEIWPTLRSKDFVVQQCRMLIDTWIMALPDGRWVEIKSPDSLRIRYFLARTSRYVRKRFNRLSGMEREAQAIFFADLFRKKFGDRTIQSIRAVLCDLFELRHVELSALVKSFSRAQILSQAHGVDLQYLENNPRTFPDSKIPKDFEWLQQRDFSTLLYSESEKPYYVKQFGLSSSQMTVSGVLRHDPEWLEHLFNSSFSQSPVEPSYIFLASRPISDLFMSRQEKYRILVMIRDYARSRGLLLVIRKHPSEKYRGKIEIEECLGPPGRRAGWIESNCHPLHLGFYCKLPISLHTSIAIDMARLGRPVIEPIDFTRCHPNTHSIRTLPDGKFASFYGQEGFALAGNGRAEFAQAADAILSGTRGGDASTAYQRCYANPDGAIRTALSALLSGMKPRSRPVD